MADRPSHSRLARHSSPFVQEVVLFAKSLNMIEVVFAYTFEIAVLNRSPPATIVTAFLNY